LPHPGSALTLAPMALRLFSTTYCPYAWCTRIVLHEKGIPFEVYEVDLKAKQDDFNRVSPSGKVPVLVDGETRVWESMVINEYLEEKYAGPRLLGDTPEERAEVRALILDLNGTRSQPLARLAAMLYYGRERRDDERIQRQIDLWEEFLDQVDRYFEDHDWYGLERFSMADINLYTMARVSQSFGLELGEARCNLRRWLERVEARDSVRRSAPTSVPEVADQLH
jgi:RNA polymerase-associated protein